MLHKAWGIGLGRTGTSTLCTAFQILGYKRVEHNPTFEQLADLDAAADNECVLYYKYLDYKFPGSKFVLTTRELEPSAREKLASAPARAATTIAETGPLARVAAVVRCHHEHWDGTGYPDGLGGESIPIGARIVAIANAFDAMLHERPYRAAMGPSDAIETLNLAAGREFDPELVDAFVQLVTEGEVPVG